MFSVFRVLDFWPIFPSFLFLVLFAPEKLSAEFLPSFWGCQKNSGKQGFSWSWFSVFIKKCYIFSIYNMWCPYARLSLRVPSSLQMSDSAWLSYLFLLFYFCFPLCFFFFWGGGLYLFTLITSMVLYQ